MVCCLWLKRIKRNWKCFDCYKTKTRDLFSLLCSWWRWWSLEWKSLFVQGNGAVTQSWDPPVHTCLVCGKGNTKRKDVKAVNKDTWTRCFNNPGSKWFQQCCFSSIYILLRLGVRLIWIFFYNISLHLNFSVNFRSFVILFVFVDYIYLAFSTST